MIDKKRNPCDGCTNRKGCITCENGELRETVQEEPVSEELWEAAQIYYEELQKEKFEGSDVIDAFKAGALWQKQQMIDKALDWAKARLTNRGYRDFKKYLENDDIQRHRHNTML